MKYGKVRVIRDEDGLAVDYVVEKPYIPYGNNDDNTDKFAVDIVEMIEALDKVTPGIAADETLMYGVEVKFYSNKVVVNKDFETSIQGLRAIGDGAGVTRGLQQASANGISVARSILTKMEQENR